MSNLRKYRKQLQPLFAELEQAGASLLRLDRGKHLKLRIRRSDGVQIMFTASCSPSDPRTRQNAVAELRRALR